VQPATIADLIEKSRRNAVDARGIAAKATVPSTRQFWLNLAAKCDQVARDYARIYERVLT
jgi:hypothetical protein